MTDYVKAAADARQLLRGFRAFEDLAQAFESVGQMLAHKAEAEAALGRLQGEVTKAQLELAAAQDQAKAELVSARIKAEDIVAKAEKRAADLIAAEEARAVEIAAAAAEKAHAIHEAAKQAKAEQLQAEVARDAAQRELTELESGIKKSRNQLAKLLG
jgi:DNA-binding helix-hairpin-helix protein with protein kinase domain